MQIARKLITENLEIWSSAFKVKASSGRGRGKNIELYGIKRLREMILELAIRGLLVEQENCDESAAKLLVKIEAERDNLLKIGKINKSKKLPRLEDNRPFQIPDNWICTQLGAISQIGPRNTLEDELEVGFVPMPLITKS